MSRNGFFWGKHHPVPAVFADEGLGIYTKGNMAMQWGYCILQVHSIIGQYPLTLMMQYDVIDVKYSNTTLFYSSRIHFHMRHYCYF